MILLREIRPGDSVIIKDIDLYLLCCRNSYDFYKNYKTKEAYESFYEIPVISGRYTSLPELPKFKLPNGIYVTPMDLHDLKPGDELYEYRHFPSGKWNEKYQYIWEDYTYNYWVNIEPKLFEYYLLLLRLDAILKKEAVVINIGYYNEQKVNLALVNTAVTLDNKEYKLCCTLKLSDLELFMEEEEIIDCLIPDASTANSKSSAIASDLFINSINDKINKSINEGKRFTYIYINSYDYCDVHTKVLNKLKQKNYSVEQVETNEKNNLVYIIKW